MTNQTDPTNDPQFDVLWAQVAPYTMTSRERGYALWTAVNTLVDNDIPGAIVECGVWKGGSAMLIALTLIQRGAANRDLILFDTFTGMTDPGAADVDIYGRPAADLIRGDHGEELADLVQAAAPLEAVRKAIASTGYDMRLVRFVEGDVCVTLPTTQTLRIGLLRLDTDFYDSTLAELRILYPRLVQGGILIIDDYGHWDGAKKAVEEYFADSDVPFSRPMLWVIDYTGRGAVKPELESGIELERYDYVPPNMSPPDLTELFPHAIAGNPWAVEWPYLRKEVPHIWRSDTRHTGWVTGNASIEEAACLYTFAKQFSGKRALEIGTHYGWTAAHLIAAGVKLDCIDPALSEAQRKKDIIEVLDGTLKMMPKAGEYKLWSGYSPEIVEEVNESAPEPWSFVFIDGNHDGDAPRDDARAVLPLLAPDAMVVFHDLTSPHVEAGLNVFREAGFNTRLINTMQVLGVAWRGNVNAPDHVADSNVPHPFAEHLTKYQFA